MIYFFKEKILKKLFLLKFCKVEVEKENKEII